MRKTQQHLAGTLETENMVLFAIVNFAGMSASLKVPCGEVW